MEVLNKQLNEVSRSGVDIIWEIKNILSTTGDDSVKPKRVKIRLSKKNAERIIRRQS